MVSHDEMHARPHNYPKCRRRWCILFLTAVCLVGLLAIFILRVLDKNNLGPQVWIEASREVKLKSIELELERLLYRVLPPQPNPERVRHVKAGRLEESMRAGADWILRMQEPSGRFVYWYDPVRDKLSPSSSDNFLRQAGTCFSLIRVYEMTADPRYLDAALSSMTYLKRYKVELNDDRAYFIFNGKSKLGGIALPMLSMLRIRKITGTNKFDEDLHKLAGMILDLQKAYGTGRFKSTYVYNGDYEYEKTTGWESNIYPGEALLALAMMYEAFGEEKYRTSIDDALAYYGQDKRWRRHAFIPWTVQACALMFELTAEVDYANFVFLLEDFQLTQQNLDARDPEYGSFHGIATVNAGSYLEGLAAAIATAERLHHEPNRMRYTARAKMACAWLLELQYMDTDKAERPYLAYGGFQKSLHEPQLRIDNTQHAVTAFAEVLLTVFDRSPAITIKAN